MWRYVVGLVQERRYSIDNALELRPSCTNPSIYAPTYILYQPQDRSVVISTYALCGFANVGSIGITLGGLSAMAPGKRTIIAQLAVRAMLTGMTVAFLNACTAGEFMFMTNCWLHDDVIKWKHFTRYWPFVRGIHQSRWNPRTKASDAELWCFFDLRPNKRLSKQPWGWWLRRHRGHYDVIVMFFNHLAKCRHVAAGTLVQIGSSQVMVCRVLGAKSRTYDGIIVNWTLRIQLQWNLNQNIYISF